MQLGAGVTLPLQLLGVMMRIQVTCDEGGKPFELFEATDNQLDEPGWYYTVMQWVPGTQVDDLLGTTGNDGRFEPLNVNAGPCGPFSSLNEAFGDAMHNLYGTAP